MTGRNLSFALILVPTIASALYLYGLAADRYVSESVVTVKQSGDQPVGLAGLASIFQVSGASAHSDLMLLQAYIQSMDMLQQLDKKLDLRKAYSAPRFDALLRLPEGASSDDFLAYYRNRIEVHLDDTTGLLVLRTQGFTADQAQQINKAIASACETFINQISQRLALDQMSFASAELAKASDKYRRAKSKMLTFQERYRMLDPAAQAAANSAMTLELQARLSRLEADLHAAESFMAPDSYQVKSLRQQAGALKEQLSAESARGTTDGRSTPRLSSVAGDFRELQIEVEFAEEAFKAATASMETARLESTRKIKSLVMVASPTKPEESEYPRRAYDLFALILGFSLIFGIVRLLVATVEDHLD